MIQYQFASLTQANALTIANDWHYPDEYSFYDMTADPENYEELIDPDQRGDQYFQAIDRDGTLVGFFALIPTDNPDVIELGLGMAPTQAGHGRGADFVQQILTYVREHVVAEQVLLDVAAFNVRAQKVYTCAGFVVAGRHDQETNGGVYPFVTMVGKLWVYADDR